MLERLTPRVYLLPTTKGSEKPSLGYICGDRFSLMIDAGNTPRYAQAFLTEIESAGLRKPNFVALTHSHWDHCFGLSGLSMPSIACVETRQSLEMVSRLQWTPNAIEENIRKGIVPSMIVPAIRENFPDPTKIRVVLPNIVFQSQMTLDLENCTCVLQHVVSPHARDTVIIFVKEERMIFLGDAVYQEPVGDTWVERPEKLRKLMETLEPMDFALCQPSHQKALSKGDLIGWFHRRLES